MVRIRGSGPGSVPKRYVSGTVVTCLQRGYRTFEFRRYAVLLLFATIRYFWKFDEKITFGLFDSTLNTVLMKASALSLMKENVLWYLMPTVRELDCFVWGCSWPRQPSSSSPNSWRQLFSFSGRFPLFFHC